MNYWHQKVALITGGSRGLGLACGRKLYQQGARVALVARGKKALDEAVEALTADPPESAGELLPIPADLLDDTQVEAAIAQVKDSFGRLDLLVNCAGRSTRGNVLDLPLDDLRDLMELNVYAPLRCTQLAADLLRESKGHVVNIGSLASKGVSAHLGSYPATKFALAAITHQLRIELAADGVHTLLVCTGPIARQDAGNRYDNEAKDLPESARKPGGGVRLKLLDPDRLVEQILSACQRRKGELILPAKAKLLFAISQLSVEWGDWIVRQMKGK